MLGLASPDVSDSLKFGKNFDFYKRLEPPIIFDTFSIQRDIVDWGEVISASPKGDFSAEVKNLFAVFDLPEDEASSITNEIHRLNDDWLGRLDSFLRLKSGYRTTSVIRVTGAGNSHFQIYSTAPTKHLQQKPPCLTIDLNIQARDQSATREEFEEVVRMCSEGKVIPLYYELLLRAHNAYQDNDPRNTVIEASTALEVAATRRIRSKLSEKEVSDKDVNSALDKNKTLRKRMALLKSIGIPYPCCETALENKILAIRNKVVHGGYPVTDSEARKLLVLVDQLIREIIPEFAIDPEP
jgi:hypothetical protein